MCMSQSKLLQAQLKDPVIARVLELKKVGEKPYRKTMSQELIAVG